MKEQSLHRNTKKFHSRKCIWKCRLQKTAILFRSRCIKYREHGLAGPGAVGGITGIQLWVSEDPIKNLLISVWRLGTTADCPNFKLKREHILKSKHIRCHFEDDILLKINYLYIGSDNGLAPNKREVTIWKKVTNIYKCIYVHHSPWWVNNYNRLLHNPMCVTGHPGSLRCPDASLCKVGRTTHIPQCNNITTRIYAPIITAYRKVF